MSGHNPFAEDGDDDLGEGEDGPAERTFVTQPGEDGLDLDEDGGGIAAQDQCAAGHHGGEQQQEQQAQAP